MRGIHIHDEIRKFLKFFGLRMLFWNILSKKRRYLRVSLRIYYAIHGKLANKLLFFVYKRQNSLIFTFLIGVVAGLCQPPVYWFFVLPFAIAMFIRMLDFPSTTKKLVYVASAFHLGYCTIAFFWPVHGAYVFGYSTTLTAIFAAVVVILSAVIPAAFSVLFGVISKNITPFYRVTLFACCWVLAEYFRSFVVFHFPFGLVGYSLGFHVAFFQSASVIGVLGISFFVILWSGVFYITLFTENKIQFIDYFRTFIVVNILFFGTVIVGYTRIKPVEFTPHQALIVQGNTSVNEEYKQSFLRYLDITKEAQQKTGFIADVVIWPEGAPMPFQATNDNIAKYIASALQPHQVFVFNSVYEETTKDGANVYNTMYVYEDGSIQQHNKHHLVPYGEYIPIIQKYKFGKAIARGAGVGFSSGEYIQAISTNKGVILPLICYEIAYSGKISPHHKLFHKTQKPNYIVNITNDEWFGRTPGPYQHFLMAQFRAVEEGLPVIRASNNGFSAIIDAYGRVVSKKTNLFEEDFTVGQIPVKTQTVFSIFGNKPLYWFCFIFLQYYVAIYWYGKNQQNIHRIVTRRLEVRDKGKQNPEYKRRW